MEEGRDEINWIWLVNLVQLIFCADRHPEALAWAVMVEYRRTGLVEMIWKLIASIVNRWLAEHITPHDALHEFQEGRGWPLWS